MSARESRSRGTLRPGWKREDAIRRGAMGTAHRLHHQRQRAGDLRAAGRRGSRGLVADGHQYRRQQVFPRPHGIAGARAQRAQLVHRVVDTIAEWGKTDGYFRTAEDAENFRNELAHLMLTQKACFNSPVWFNVGVKEARGYGWYYDEATDRFGKLEDRPDEAAVLGLLHQLGARQPGIHPRSGQDRRHAVQVGLGHGHQSFHAARGRSHSFRRRARLRVR